VRADQTLGCGNEVGVVFCLLSVGQQRHVFEPGADAMSSLERASIDGPARDAITMVDLLQRDTRGCNNVFHPGGVLNSNVGIGVERLDKDAAATACQTGTHERSRIFNAQQSSLDSDASRQQELTKLYDSALALIRGNEVGHLLPGVDDSQPLFRIRNYRR
jgi:hypothetical protein